MIRQDLLMDTVNLEERNKRLHLLIFDEDLEDNSAWFSNGFKPKKLLKEKPRRVFLMQNGHYQLHYNMVALSEKEVISVTRRGVELFDLVKNSPRTIYRTDAKVFSIDYSPIHSSLCFSTSSGIFVKKGISGKETKLPLTNDPNDLCRSIFFDTSSSSFVGTCGNFSSQAVFDLETGKSSFQIPTIGYINDMHFIDSTQTMLLTGDEGKVLIYDHRSPSSLKEIYSMGGPCFAVKAIDDNLIIAAGEASKVAMIDLRKNVPVQTINHFRPIYAIEVDKKRKIVYLLEEAHCFLALDLKKDEIEVVKSFGFCGSLALSPSKQKLFLSLTQMPLRGLIEYDVL